MLGKIKAKLRRMTKEKNFCQNAEVTQPLTLIASAHCRNEGNKENIKIGKHCTIGAEFIALFGGKIIVGENTYIGPGTSIQAKESITVGNNVIIANNVILLDNNNHPVEPEKRLAMSACEDFMRDELWTWEYAESAPIVIEDNVWVGRDARILKGVTVGKGAVVALGSIVTHDVPPYCVVAGNPARVVKKLSQPGETE